MHYGLDNVADAAKYIEAISWPKMVPSLDLNKAGSPTVDVFGYGPFSCTMVISRDGDDSWG